MALTRALLVGFVSMAACSNAPAPNAPAPSPTSPGAVPPGAQVSPSEAAAPSATADATGELTVNVAEAWGEVWLDGERVTDETPLNAWQTSAGEHAVRVVNPRSGSVLYDGRVDVRAGVMTILHLDGVGGHRIEYFDN